MTSLDDIQYWVGGGANRAGMLIDWNGNSSADESLAWGFRWDGAATGEQMLRAVVAADDRLFAKIDSSGAYGVAVRGLGYDASDDGQFGVDDDVTVFDSPGFAQGGPSDGAVPLDAADRYREGWYTGVWNYSTTNSNPASGGKWIYSGFGASGRALVNGSWDSWAFTSTFRQSAVAANVLPATQPADIDSNGAIDGADLLTLQRNLGLSSGATRPQGDATIDGHIDQADLAEWSSTFGGLAATTAAFAVVPEPASWISFGTCASAMLLFLRHVFLTSRKE